MAKSKTEKAKSLLNPPPEVPRGSTAAQVKAIKKEFVVWQNEAYKTCQNEIKKLQKGWFDQYSEWLKTEPSKPKDC